jgi:hypothetical protein
MRKLMITLILFATGYVSGQELRIPNTPAFSILEYEPSAVMRPNSAKKLSSDIMSSFDADGKLIMNLGMEVSPYWLKSRSELSREEYLDPGLMQLIAQTFTLSAATVKDTISGKNNLGFGLRFEVVKGKVSDEFKKAEAEELEVETVIELVLNEGDRDVATLSEAIIRINNAMKVRNISDSRISEVNQYMTTLAKEASMTPDAFFEKLANIYAEISRTNAISIRALENQRTGFGLEFAAASSLVAEHAIQKLGRAGVWVNASYYMSPQDAWTITARQMWSSRDTTSVNTDVGLSYIRQEKEFNVSLEALARWYRTEVPDINQAGNSILSLEKEFTYRVAAQLSYTLSKEISVNLSVGKDFQDTQFQRSGVFSILGLNYSLWRERP